jgi:hypothetical protein
VSGVISPTRADVVIVRRSGERHETIDIERWDVHTFGGEVITPNFATREAAEAAGRRIARERGVSVFYEHDPQRPDSALQLIAAYGPSDPRTPSS